MKHFSWQRGFLRVWAVLSVVWALAIVADLWARYPTGGGQFLELNGNYVVGINRAIERAHELKDSDPEGSRKLVSQISEAEQSLAMKRKIAVAYSAAYMLLAPILSLSLIFSIGWAIRGFQLKEQNGGPRN